MNEKIILLSDFFSLYVLDNRSQIHYYYYNTNSTNYICQTHFYNKM